MDSTTLAKRKALDTHHVAEKRICVGDQVNNEAGDTSDSDSTFPGTRATHDYFRMRHNTMIVQHGSAMIGTRIDVKRNYQGFLSESDSESESNSESKSESESESESEFEFESESVSGSGAKSGDGKVDADGDGYANGGGDRIGASGQLDNQEKGCDQGLFNMLFSGRMKGTGLGKAINTAITGELEHANRAYAVNANSLLLIQESWQKATAKNIELKEYMEFLGRAAKSTS